MRFVHLLTVPRNTPKSAAVEAQAELVQGLITKMEVSFPPGCAALVNVAVRDRLYQVAPANREGFFAYDNITLVFSVNYELINPPFDLTLIGFSPGTNFKHTITFRFDVTPAGDVSERSVLEALLDRVALPARGR